MQFNYYAFYNTIEFLVFFFTLFSMVQSLLGANDNLQSYSYLKLPKIA